jgi:hypothetical protein
MTDDSIEAKALALVNEVEREECEKELTPRIMRGLIMDEALCRALEQHEAFRQQVSDVVYKSLTSIVKGCAADAAGDLSRFIIPKPKPDQLVRVINEVIYAQPHGDIDEVRMANNFRAAMEACGLEIREKGQ